MYLLLVQQISFEARKHTSYGVFTKVISRCVYQSLFTENRDLQFIKQSRNLDYGFVCMDRNLHAGSLCPNKTNGCNRALLI